MLDTGPAPSCEGRKAVLQWRGLMTFLLGTLTGTLVAMTDRIGGAILAHMLFNLVAVVATWPR